MEGTIELPGGRTVGFATYGSEGGVRVIWCHGGPGCRLDSGHLDVEATGADLLLVGIDRPGYGKSTPFPGRTLSDWVPDALAVADELGIDKFIAIGVSTGGAYALALAALLPDRVLAAVACCSMTDMRFEEGQSHHERPSLPCCLGCT
jgi:pimeloyl-ACP methyl ester carboxylesterase